MNGTNERKLAHLLEYFQPKYHPLLIAAYTHASGHEHKHQLLDAKKETERFSERLKEQGMCLGVELLCSAINVAAIIETLEENPINHISQN